MIAATSDRTVRPLIRSARAIASSIAPEASNSATARWRAVSTPDGGSTRTVRRYGCRLGGGFAVPRTRRIGSAVGIGSPVALDLTATSTEHASRQAALHSNPIELDHHTSKGNPMNLSFKKTAATMMVAAGAVAGLAVIGAPTASASSPICTKAVDTDSHTRYERWQPFSGPASTWNCVMYAGHGGVSAVMALQDALNRCHGYHLDVDGGYGTLTGNAVFAINGKDHVYGPITRAKMNWPIYDSVTGAFRGCSHTG